MIKEIEQHIAQARPEKAIEVLLQITQKEQRKFYQDALLLSGRYRNYVLKNCRKSISQEEANLELNRINTAILTVADLMEQDAQTASTVEQPQATISKKGNIVLLNDTPHQLRELMTWLAGEAGLNISGEKQTSTVAERALSRLIHKEERRQRNIEAILSKAFNSMANAQDKETTDELDEDWIAAFFDVCQDFSEERMQDLWAALLANEVDKPGQFSRRTLNTLKLLSSKEATMFTQFCTCIWKLEAPYFGEDYLLIMDMDEQGRYSDETWGFNGSRLSRLEELGLVHISYLELDNRRHYQLTFYGEKHQLYPQQQAQRLDVATLTQTGVELFSVCGSTPNYPYYITTLKYLEGLQLLNAAKE